MANTSRGPDVASGDEGSNLHALAAQAVVKLTAGLRA
jgi:hypothetical protein